MEENIMLVVRSDALPTIYGKVILAKKMLASNKSLTASEAAKSVGISRSAFYKYKDAVFTYSELTNSNTANLSLVLKDEKGSLSKIISVISSYGANILTINQSVPNMGVAGVTISLACSPSFSKSDFLSTVKGIPEVVSVTIQ